MKELQRDMAYRLWPRAKLLNCLALYCETKKRGGVGRTRGEKVRIKMEKVSDETKIYMILAQ